MIFFHTHPKLLSQVKQVEQAWENRAYSDVSFALIQVGLLVSARKNKCLLVDEKNHLTGFSLVLIECAHQLYQLSTSIVCIQTRLMQYLECQQFKRNPKFSLLSNSSGTKTGVLAAFIEVYKAFVFPVTV